MRFQQHIGMALGLAIALASPLTAHVPAVAAEMHAAAYALIGRAAFDPHKTAITVPFKGPAPNVTLYQLSPTHFYYEFEASRLALGGVQYQAVGDTMERFTMANRPNAVVRLSFKLLRPGMPRFAVDKARGQIRILPLGAELATRTTRVAAKPKPKPVEPPQAGWKQPTPLYQHRVTQVAPPASLSPPSSWTAVPAKVVAAPKLLKPPSAKNALRTEIGRPYLDDFHHRLVLPFHGPAPEFKVLVHQKNPRWVYLDFEQSSVKLQGERFDSFSDAIFDGWMLTEPAGTNRTRLYLKFKTAMPVVAQIYPESGEMWFLTPKPTDQPPPTLPASPAAPSVPVSPSDPGAAQVAPDESVVRQP